MCVLYVNIINLEFERYVCARPDNFHVEQSKLLLVGRKMCLNRHLNCIIVKTASPSGPTDETVTRKWVLLELVKNFGSNITLFNWFT
jgi:hypothetical protein